MTQNKNSSSPRGSQSRRYFMPYREGKPVAVVVNGHRLLILSSDKEPFEDHLESLGADSVRSVRGGASKFEEEQLFQTLAKSADAGIVIAPGDLELRQILSNLESELPWLH